MPATPSDLAELRRRLDEIDDKLHDLLIERGEIISMVAASKRDGKLAAFQPGREAEIDPAVEPQRLAHKQTMAGPLLARS